MSFAAWATHPGNIQSKSSSSSPPLSKSQEKINKGSLLLAERLASIALCTAHTAYGSNKSSTTQWYFATALSIWNDEIISELSNTEKIQFETSAFKSSFDSELKRRLGVNTLPESLIKLSDTLSSPIKKFTESAFSRNQKMGDTSKSMRYLDEAEASQIRRDLDSSFALSKKQKIDCAGTEKKTYFWSKFDYLPEDNELSTANPEKISAEESERELASKEPTSAPTSTKPEVKHLEAEEKLKQENEVAFKEKAEEELKKIPPMTEKSSDLLDRFKAWLGQRELKTVEDFHKLTLSNLEKSPHFQSMLIDRNPFGQMCTNYLDLGKEEREKVVSKSFLVHLLAENFDNPKTENLGSYQNDSVGPWQTAMNTKGYGCTFKNHDEIKYNVDKNVHCLMTFYSFREEHYDKIYGRSKDPKVSNSKSKASGLHWSVLKEGSGNAFFEEKYEPLFKSATQGTCKSTYNNSSSKSVVNGHSTDDVSRFIAAVI